jgi:threonine synthase
MGREFFVFKEVLFMIYSSTRNNHNIAKSKEAIIRGIAADGGLYVPESIPTVDLNEDHLINMDYHTLARFIMSKYLTDFSTEELMDCIEKAYDDKFTQNIATLVDGFGISFLELYHGPTQAFKDMALSILPHLLKQSMATEGLNKRVVILTATSGDTGKAALQGFSEVDGTSVIVFYPRDGVSEIQKRQMITHEGSNTFVVGIDGDFDDAQRGVKDIFNDESLKAHLDEKNYMLSSANSINIGRLIPQIVYYFHGYLEMLRSGSISQGECINFVVPTGNFGNILAAYYAKKMGLPVNKLICASNENNILFDFLRTGTYDAKRALRLTSSPSMDILISSNLERLLYEISSHDSTIVGDLMKKLQTEGKYEITNEMQHELKDFYGNFASEDEVFKNIKQVFETSGYLMDTHTGVAYSVYKKYLSETGDNTKTIVVSTASPFKFGKSVSLALGIDIKGLNEFEINKKLSGITGVSLPEGLKNLEERDIIHDNSCKKDEMKAVVRKILL